MYKRQGLGHSLARMTDSPCMLLCTRCGAYCEQKGRLLYTRCQGSSCTQFNKVRRFVQGWHPVKQLHLGQLVRLPAKLLAESFSKAAREEEQQKLQHDPVQVLMDHVQMVDEFSQPWAEGEADSPNRAMEEQAAMELQGDDFWME